MSLASSEDDLLGPTGMRVPGLCVFPIADSRWVDIGFDTMTHGSSAGGGLSQEEQDQFNSDLGRGRGVGVPGQGGRGAGPCAELAVALALRMGTWAPGSQGWASRVLAVSSECLSDPSVPVSCLEVKGSWSGPWKGRNPERSGESQERSIIEKGMEK